MSAIISDEIKNVEWHFFHYEDIKKAVDLRREEIIKGRPAPPDDIRSGPTGRPSDPTGKAAAALNDIRVVVVNGELVRWPEKWLRVVEATVRNFENKCIGDYIQAKYFRRMDFDMTCIEVRIERSTFYAWRDQVVNYALMACVQAGIIKVF